MARPAGCSAIRRRLPGREGVAHEKRPRWRGRARSGRRYGAGRPVLGPVRDRLGLRARTMVWAVQGRGPARPVRDAREGAAGSAFRRRGCHVPARRGRAARLQGRARAPALYAQRRSRLDVCARLPGAGCQRRARTEAAGRRRAGPRGHLPRYFAQREQPVSRFAAPGLPQRVRPAHGARRPPQQPGRRHHDPRQGRFGGLPGGGRRGGRGSVRARCAVAARARSSPDQSNGLPPECVLADAGRRQPAVDRRPVSPPRGRTAPVSRAGARATTA